MLPFANTAMQTQPTFTVVPGTCIVKREDRHEAGNPEAGGFM